MAPRAPGPVLDNEGRATKTDQDRLRRHAAERDETYKRGYQDAKAGHDGRRPLDPRLEEYYNAGRDFARAEDREPAVADEPIAAGEPRPQPAPARTNAQPGPGAGAAGGAPAYSFEIGNQGASFLLGLVGYALVLNYLRYGWPGVTGWLSAKFLNKVTIGQTAAQPGPTVLVPNANPRTGGPAPQAGGLFA